MGREAGIFFLWAMGYQLAWLPGRLCPVPDVLLPACWLAGFLLWCFRTGRASFVRLERTEVRWLSLWPLGILPAWNLLHWGLPRWDAPALLAAVAEELLFRGVLLAFLEKGHPRGGVFLSAILFAAYHWVSPDRGALQLWCALSAGVCYGEATLRAGAVWPAVLAHLAVNFTGARGTEGSSPSLWLWAAVPLVWGIRSFMERKRDSSCSYT